MLILVGVTVTVAINGGLFEKSKEAAKGTEIGREKEELTSAITTAYDEATGKIDKTKLKDALSGWTVDGEEGGPYTVTSPNQNIYNVAINGTITEKSKTSEVTITAENYGDKVAYSAGGVNDWKIFYKDENYVYIITSDYLNNVNLPTGLNMSTYENYPYSAYWSSVSNFTSIGASDITTAVADKYGLSWLKNNAGLTNNNAKATADLLNVSAWTAKFGNASKGIEAIGGPTLEMWVKSWNEKSTIQLKTENSVRGYFVGPTTTGSLSEVADEYDSAKGGYMVKVSNDTKLYKEESLYFPHVSTYGNCVAYWLASPSTDGDFVNAILKDGLVSRGRYHDCGYGVRPVVSLPSNIIREKDTSGAWRVDLD